MSRNFQSPPITIPHNGATSNAFAVKDFAWGSFQLPTIDGSGVTATFLVSNDGTNFAALHDQTGTAVSAVPVASGQITPFPDELFYNAYAKIQLSANQTTAAVAVSMLLKD